MLRLCLLTLCLSLAAMELSPTPAPEAPLRPVRPETVDGRFFALLDLDRADLAATRALAAKGDYAGALAAWRDAQVMKLRARPGGTFGWHGYLLHPNRRAWADRLLGDTTAAKADDVMGLTGPPDPTRKIDWLARGATGDLADYMGWRGFNPLVSMYQQQRDPRFLAKWFEVTATFAVDQKRAEDALAEDDRKGRPLCWERTNHGANLAAAGRTHNILTGLAYFAKALPDGAPPRDWNSAAGLPIATPLEPGATELIPAGELADIALSLIYDHVPLLIAVYGDPGRTPNQRYSGLTGIARIAHTFDEFKAGPGIMRVGGGCIENYVRVSVLPDGGDMEQSFNYNAGFIKEGREILELFAETEPRPQWLDVLRTAIEKRERLLAGVTSPLGVQPRIGTYGGASPFVVWKDAKTLERWRERQLREVQPIAGDPLAQRIYDQLLGPRELELPPFTSVAYPYSGYYALRDGWDNFSLYLWLIASRQGAGHRKENINGIAVTAYGRNLIVDAGPPPYGPSFCTDDQRQYYKQMVGYFGEASSLAANTVLVDGQSQRRHQARHVTQAYDRPIAARWHSSAAFDLTEGRYDDGYGGGGWGTPAAITVRHHRLVLFLRQQHLWLVTDHLAGDGKPHTYQQLWHFPPPHVQWNNDSPGFREDQVVTDPETATIRTDDPEAPNVVLRQFAAMPIGYERYFGQTDPWRGWYGIGIGGTRFPAVEVNACWDSDGDSLVTTAILPTPHAGNPVTAAEDLSTAGTTGCHLVLGDGTDVTWLAAGEPAVLTAGDLTAEAKGLLLVRAPGQPPRGLVLDARSLRRGKDDVAGIVPDFEFAVEGGAVRVVAPIEYPATPDVASLRPEPGLFVQPVVVDVLPPRRPGATLRYTLDGTLPTATSPVTAGTVDVTATGEVVVRPFRAGKPSGEAVRGRYEILPLPPVPPTPQVFLSDLDAIRAVSEGFDLTRDKCCYQDRPLSLGDEVFTRGISVHVSAEVAYALKSEYRRFVGVVGLDDVTGAKGSIVVRVLADGKLLTETPALAGSGQRFWRLDCPLPAGARELVLEANPGPLGGGWGMTDFANAGFITAPAN